MAADRGDTSGRDALSVLRSRSDLRPEVAIMLGSGLGEVLEPLTERVAVPYADMPGFPTTSVPGHAGQLVLGRVEGTAVAVLQGRAHLYEGAPAAWPRVPIRTLKALGAGTILLTNAAGSLRSEIGPGRLCLISDHINGLGANPLTGANDDEAGPRFPDMSAVYDVALQQDFRRLAAEAGLDLAGGVYLATPGPSFETPAEIRAMRAIGADLVGMSTVPEAIVARHAGLRVAGLAVVTNLAAGLGNGTLSHEETLATAGAAAADLGRLVRAWLRSLAPAGKESAP
ncbi:purine-nucleoside phosphorylase [Marinivivus vitaminiproducens]|nr:purine-nucleoside phosphorylase [Geminicoccaceae bacterium SCSIO 64248]